MMAAALISVTSFTVVDWVVVLILIFSVVSSFKNGFVRELLGLAFLVLAFLLSSWSYQSVSGLFKDVVKTENLALFLGFSVVFLVTLVVGFLVIWLITKFVKFANIQWFDRLLGAAFGFIRGWLLASILFLGLTSFGVQAERIRDSQLAPYLLPGARVVALLTPYDLKARFLVGYRAVERWWLERS